MCNIVQLVFGIQLLVYTARSLIRKQHGPGYSAIGPLVMGHTGHLVLGIQLLICWSRVVGYSVIESPGIQLYVGQLDIQSTGHGKQSHVDQFVG